MSADPWATYDAWNYAIGARFFQGQHANKPVYLDMEDEVLSAVAAAFGTEDGNPAETLVQTVKATLTLPPREGSMFGAHVRHSRAWVASGRVGTPPFLALLAFFSLVAERMRTDSKFRATNYYGRLCSMLGLPGQSGPVKTRVTRNYMEQAPLLWRLYNNWIEEGDGKRGKPTAYAFDYRVHVGVPISQALVQERDRRKFPEFFHTYRLQPGQVISRSDMARLLSDWLPAASISAGLKALIRQPEASEQIADIACVELQAWDGAIPEQASQAPGRRMASVALIARLHWHPRPSLMIEALVRALSPLPAGTYVLDAGSSPHAYAALEALGGRVELLPPHLEGWQGFRDDYQFSVPDLLFAYLRLTRGDVEIRREPRRLVVLEYDEGSWSFSEVPRAHLGRDLLLLCVESIAAQVAELLQANARPGFREHRPQSLPGLPSGWIAFSSVELMRIPETAGLDFSALVPVAWTEVALGGGFRLPGRSTWLRGGLPEVRVTALSEAREMEVLLLREGTHDDPSARLGAFTGGQVIDLSKLDLPEGDYRVALEERGGAGRVLASAALRVRSAAHPRVLRGDERTWVVHRLNNHDGWAMLSASTESQPPATASVTGARLQGVNGATPGPRLLPPRRLGTEIQWGADEPDPVQSPAEARAGEPPDCLTTGAHYILLPPAGPERPRWNAKIQGTCKYCGLEKWFPARPPRRWSAQRREDRRAPVETGTAGRRSPVKPLDFRPVTLEQGFGFDELLQALAFARRGPWSWLEGVAAQVSDEPWFPLEAARLLSALGHLELILDRHTLHPVEWAVAPPTLATIAAEGKAFLSGWRSPPLLERLADDASRLGGQVSVESGDGKPPIVVIAGLGMEELELVAETASAEKAEEIMVSEEPARKLAAQLLPLSVIVAQLSAFTPPVGQPLEQWDPRTNRWTVVDDVTEPAAYRTRSLPRRHGFRSERASGRSLMRGDARLVKWLAAREQGIGLLAYDQARQELLCRIGAGLPGLYERAAVLSSGRPPSTDGGTLAYEGVPPAIAGAIWEAVTR
jgi:hypothetical protein